MGGSRGASNLSYLQTAADPSYTPEKRRRGMTSGATISLSPTAGNPAHSSRCQLRRARPHAGPPAPLPMLPSLTNTVREIRSAIRASEPWQASIPGSACAGGS